MKKFKQTQVWEDKDILAMTQLILIEATRDTTFDVSFNFRAEPSDVCQFHGDIDCLLYQRYGGDHEGIPDLKEHIAEGNTDDRGIGFPLLPIFFQVDRIPRYDSIKIEEYPLT